MNWLENLRKDRSLRPGTVSESESSSRSLPDDAPLSKWLRAAFTTGEGADKAEADALDRLRGDEGASDQIARTYRATPETNYALRWALVHAAAELNTPRSADFLNDVLRSSIPPERSEDFHNSTVGEETTIRFQALAGLQRLAADGRVDVREVLFEHVEHPSHAIRAMTRQLIQELPGRPIADDELRNRMPRDDQQAILDLRRMPIEQLDAGRDRPKGIPLPQPPGSRGGGGRVLRQDRRSPKARGQG